MLRSLAVLLVFGALAMAAPLPKATFKKLKDYYPLAKGHTWTYLVGESEIVVVVTEFEEAKDGTKTAKLTTQVAGKSVATASIRTGKDGIFRTHINDLAIEPPVQLLKFDKEDEEWEIKSKMQTIEVTSSVKHLGEEKIEVKAGTYTAVKIRIKADLAMTKTEVTYWLVEDVGIAKLEFTAGENQRGSLNLKSFAPGKEK